MRRGHGTTYRIATLVLGAAALSGWGPLGGPERAAAAQAAGAAAPGETATEATSAMRKLEDTPRLSVRGEAELRRPADLVVLQVGVVTQNADAGAALRENNERMRAVIKAIEKQGITEDEYETGQFRIRPRYARRPRGEVDPDWSPTIVGYDVTNDLTIRTKRLASAGDVIGAANAAGANSAEVAGFTLADARTHRGEAIAEATRNAIADARALAEAASLELVRIVSISLDHSEVPRPEAMGRMAMAAADTGSPPISSGDVTVRAAVSVIYEIAPKP